jgi:hypothetical protein
VATKNGLMALRIMRRSHPLLQTQLMLCQFFRLDALRE